MKRLAQLRQAMARRRLERRARFIRHYTDTHGLSADVAASRSAAGLGALGGIGGGGYGGAGGDGS